MITYNLRKPVKTNACNSVGVMGENNSFTAKFFIDKLVDSDLSFSIHLRFADGSVNTVVPDEAIVDDKGTTIIWNVKNTDIFVHGFFELQIEGRKSNGYVFQTEIVRMYADESICIEDKKYKNPNSETLKLREEAYELLCELKLQQDRLDENMRQLLATDITNKADKATVISGFEGNLNFALYSDFINAQTNSSDGTLNTDVKYRVTSENIMNFDYDLNVSVDSGFTAYVVKYSNGSYVSIKSLSDTNGYVIPANTEFRLHIRRNPENTAETANINEFVNAVKFQTKIAAEVELKADKAEVDASLALKADNCSLVLNSEGLSGFALYGSFVRGNARSTDGTINKDTKYRVTSENIMQFDYDLNISVDDGFTAYVVKFENGTYVSIKSLSDTNGYVIPANTEFRLHIRRKTENTAETANISEFVSAVNFRTKIAAEVADVDSRVKVVEDKIDNIPDNNTIPDYYYADNYLPNKIDEIKKACSVLHGVTFAFITDVHFKANQKQSKKLLRKVLDETNVPFVLCGGDIVYLVGTEEELYEQITDFNEFKSCIGKDRLFCTRGNHDLYNATIIDPETREEHKLTTADAYDTLFRDTETKVSSMSVDNGCYCIDNEPQKTRIIMLNTTDVSGDFDYEGGGVSFRSGTLQWLSAALTEKTDYKIIIVCHTPLNYETFTNDVDSGENRDGLSLMVQAFKNKTEFETTRFGTTVQADFRNNTNELICVISGHRHIDGNSVENNVLNIVTTCDCIDKKDGYGRKAGTISEQAFDVFCINYDTNTINTVRIGAGSNREIEF